MYMVYLDREYAWYTLTAFMQWHAAHGSFFSKRLKFLRTLVAGCFTLESLRNSPRYKLVLQATMGEVRGQGARHASRCLWNAETDNYANVRYTNVRKETFISSVSCDEVFFCVFTPTAPTPFGFFV